MVWSFYDFFTGVWIWSPEWAAARKIKGKKDPLHPSFFFFLSPPPKTPKGVQGFKIMRKQRRLALVLGQHLREAVRGCNGPESIQSAFSGIRRPPEVDSWLFKMGGGINLFSSVNPWDTTRDSARESGKTNNMFIPLAGGKWKTDPPQPPNHKPKPPITGKLLNLMAIATKTILQNTRVTMPIDFRALLDSPDPTSLGQQQLGSSREVGISWCPIFSCSLF